MRGLRTAIVSGGGSAGQGAAIRARESALFDKADLGTLVPTLRCRNAKTALRQR
jgi:succinate dehydrogenase/fumarate reductase flavoprotein subunit